MKKCEYCEFKWQCVYKKEIGCQDFDKFKINDRRVEEVITQLEEQNATLEQILVRHGKIQKIILGRRLSIHDANNGEHKEVFTFGGFTYAYVYECFVEEYGENNAQRMLNEVLSTIKLGDVKEIFVRKHIKSVDCDKVGDEK